MTTEDFYHTIIPLRDDLLRYAVSLTASSDDADDLAQETLLRLWDMRERLDAGDNLRAMAVTMLRNRFYDQQRHASHSRRLSAADDIGREDLGAQTGFLVVGGGACHVAVYQPGYVLMIVHILLPPCRVIWINWVRMAIRARERFLRRLAAEHPVMRIISSAV